MLQYALTGSMCAVTARLPIRHQASFDIWICLDKVLNVLCNVTSARPTHVVKEITQLCRASLELQEGLNADLLYTQNISPVCSHPAI